MDDTLKPTRAVWKPVVGVTAIFECKASREDFRRDARLMKAMLERLRLLHERKEKAEDELRIFYPSIRNGDSLFQEFETLNFERPGYERYQELIAEIRQLSARLHANTKFDRLSKYAAANLFYIVTDPGLFRPHEAPAGWGLLHRVGNELAVITKPLWHDVSDDERLGFLHRISMAATRSVNREHNVVFSPDVRRTRLVRDP